MSFLLNVRSRKRCADGLVASNKVGRFSVIQNRLSIDSEFGDTLEGPALQAMTAHVESHPKGRFGKHGYDPSEYGLDAGEIAERFRPYVERYDIPLETGRA